MTVHVQCIRQYGGVVHSATTARNIRADPLLLAISGTGFFDWHYTTHGTCGFVSHSKDKDKAVMVKCLA